MQTINPLTGLYFDYNFFEKADEFLKTVKPDTHCMMAIDIEHFRIYNHIHGREEGDQVLIIIANILKAFQMEYGGVIGYLGGDNFALLTTYDEKVLDGLRQQIRAEIKVRNKTVGYPPAYGIYAISDPNVSAKNMYDRATTALSYVIGNYTNRCCEYYPDMDQKVEEEIRLLTEIQEGMENDEFTFFIQPQCNISKSKIVGGESLVRWQHGDKGLISPGVFVPILEKNGFIADLDSIIWEKVCGWIRSCLDRGFEPVPISINISRIDIFSIDVPTVLEDLVKKYDIANDLLKIEITESAYTENNEKIIETVNRLRDKGFLVMMDDFGSGYSSLNMLKSVPVDVLKMDMRFLDISEKEEEKGIGILESVINMARQMRIPIIVEGVETEHQEEFLKKMSCRYAQGYHYYRPMPVGAFEELLSDETNLDFEGFWYKQDESVHVREFLDTNLFNDEVFNNILGPVVFYDLYENRIEITRVNDQYFQLVGLEKKKDKDYRNRFWNGVRDDDRLLLYSILAQAYDDQTTGASGYINYLRSDGETLWVNIRAYFLREKEGHKLFYASLTDATAMKNSQPKAKTIETGKLELTDKQRQHMDKYYGNISCALGIGQVIVDEAGNPTDYEIVYANKVLSQMSGGTIARLKYMIRRLFPDNLDEFIQAAYKAAYQGEDVSIHIYSSMSSRYLDINFYQYQYGYACCMLQDITHSYIYESISNTVMSVFREVYFLDLRDNYCRMIYPNYEQITNRGNYEEMVNRHFDTGVIRPEDSHKVREFLSLENLCKVLLRQDSVAYKYKRRIGEVGEEWCQTRITVTERKDGIPKTATITIASVESIVREQESGKHQNMAKMLNSMSDGFFIYKNDDTEEILYANPPVLKTFGCTTVAQFQEMTANSFKGMVHPDDLARIEWEIKEQIKHSSRNMDYIYYRIIRADGEIRWIDDCGHLEKALEENGMEIFYVFISDVTDTMTEAQKIKLINQSKRFKK